MKNLGAWMVQYFGGACAALHVAYFFMIETETGKRRWRRAVGATVAMFLLGLVLLASGCTTVAPGEVRVCPTAARVIKETAETVNGSDTDAITVAKTYWLDDDGNARVHCHEGVHRQRQAEHPYGIVGWSTEYGARWLACVFKAKGSPRERGRYCYENDPEEAIAWEGCP